MRDKAGGGGAGERWARRPWGSTRAAPVRSTRPGILGNLCKSISSALTGPPDLQRAEQIPVSTNNVAFIGLLDL